jgi:hypothetical protein
MVAVFTSCKNPNEQRKFNDLIYKKAFPNRHLHVIVNLAVGGDFPLHQPDDKTDFPTEFEVDYIKVWQ